MNADRNNKNFECEPLPIDFDPSLIEVDRLLSRSAGISANDAPAGLSQRVFEMSVASLPSAQTAEPAMRLIENDDESRYSFARYATTSTRWRWGWAAMAASVLLVAGVTLWMNWQPSPVSPIAGNNNNGGQPGGAGDTTPSVRMVSVDFSDLNRIAASNPSEIDAYESEFTYLLDASEVRSFNDLNNDLRQFVAQLEM